MADAPKPEVVKPETTTEEKKTEAPVDTAPAVPSEAPATSSAPAQAPVAAPAPSTAQSEFHAFAQAIDPNKLTAPVEEAPAKVAPAEVAPAPASDPVEAVAPLSKEIPSKTPEAVPAIHAADATKASQVKEPLAKEAGSVPDPEEDDLDDLDDILDEFSEGKQGKPKTGEALAALATEGSTAPAPAENPFPIPTQTQLEDAAASLGGDDDFSAQLQAGMADLLNELQSSPEMQREFENLVKEFGDASGPIPDFGNLKGKVDAAAPSSSTAGAAPPAAPGSSADPSFQDSILKAMQRMQESGQQASAAAAEDNPDDILAELLKQMQSGDLDAAGGEEGFSKLLLGMMEQLTNKEILYEPMKELNEKFPEWIEKNQATLPKEDLDRYLEQQAVVKEIVTRFENPAYSDSNSADREYIVERMQKMQAAGSPPPDLVGDMSVAQDALNDLDQGCPQS